MTSPEEQALQEIIDVVRVDPEFFDDLGSIDDISDLAERYGLDYRVVADMVSSLPSVPSPSIVSN